MNNKEIRSINSEFRIAPDSRKIEGYALLFNKESHDLGGFKEIISRNSLNGVIERSDILALFNHDENKILARATNGKGTLSLNIDEIGLRYSFSAPDTQLGNEVYDMIRRGDIRNSSFAFTVSDSGQKWEKRGDSYIRTITQFDRLFDTSVVARPAYQDTTVAVRSLENFSTENRTEEKQYIQIEGKDLISVLDKNKNNMDERQEISVEIKVEVSEDVEDMPVDTLEPMETEPTEEPIVEPMMDPMMEPTEEPADTELIDVVIDGENYSIPKNILEPYLSNRKLELYFQEIENSIERLKK